MPALPRKWFLGFGLLFGLCSIVSVWLFQPLILALPFLILAFLWVCHDPFVLYYALIAALPWSIEYNFTPALGTDLPTEPLMLLTSFALLCFLVYHARNRPLKGFFSSPLALLLLAQAGWWVVTAYFSTDFTRSIKFCLAKGWYLAAFVLTTFLLLRQTKNLSRIARVFGLSMMLLVARTMLIHAGYRFTFDTINPSLYPQFRNHVNYSAVLVCTIPLLATGWYFA
ncbi:MAG: hypothetical protein EOP50_16300, partial [Sphingobacteriales bacterium]